MIMSPRQIAVQKGDTTYEGKPCKKGHTTRYTGKKDYFDGNCVECVCQRHRIRNQKLRETVEGRKQLVEKHLKSRYDITGKDWERMYEEQNGICANPNCDFISHPRWWEQGRGKGLQVDHDHNTEEVRGLLCHECNKLEGVVFKSPKKTMGIIEYRRVWDENKCHLNR